MAGENPWLLALRLPYVLLVLWMAISLPVRHKGGRPCGQACEGAQGLDLTLQNSSWVKIGPWRDASIQVGAATLCQRQRLGRPQQGLQEKGSLQGMRAGGCSFSLTQSCSNASAGRDFSCWVILCCSQGDPGVPCWDVWEIRDSLGT